MEQQALQVVYIAWSNLPSAVIAANVLGWRGSFRPDIKEWAPCRHDAVNLTRNDRPDCFRSLRYKAQMTLAKAFTQIGSLTVWPELNVVNSVLSACLLELPPPRTVAGKDEAITRMISEALNNCSDGVYLMCEPQIARIFDDERTVSKVPWMYIPSICPVFGDMYLFVRNPARNQSLPHVGAENNNRACTAAAPIKDSTSNPIYNSSTF